MLSFIIKELRQADRASLLLCGPITTDTGDTWHTQVLYRKVDSYDLATKTATLGEWDYLGQRILTASEGSEVTSEALGWADWYQHNEADLAREAGRAIGIIGTDPGHEPDWSYGQAWANGWSWADAPGKWDPGYGGLFDLSERVDQFYYVPNTILDGSRVEPTDNVTPDLEADPAKTRSVPDGDENQLGDEWRRATGLLLLSFERPDGPGSRRLIVRLTMWEQDPGSLVPFVYTISGSIALRN